jgi:hypothetical protein
MGRFSDIDIELKEMSTSELIVRFESLKRSPSKGVMDELYQDLYARELDQRESNKQTEEYSPYWGA